MSVPHIIRARLSRLVAICTSRARLPVGADAATPTTTPSTAATTSPHHWHPMPGRCLEYGSTGWQIRMEQTWSQGVEVMYYAAINPEGMTVSTAQNDLQRLKQSVEQMAHNREEFSL